MTKRIDSQRRRPRWQTSAILLLIVAGCTSPDSPQVSPPDTTTAVSGQVDTVAADTLLSRVPTTAAVPPAAGPVVPPASMDSLLDRIDRLQSTVAGMEARLASSGRVTASAAVDTAGVVQTREKIRETTEDVRNFGLRAFWAVVLMAGAFFFIKFLVWLLETLSERSAKRRLFFKKLIPISRILVWVLVVYYVVSGIFEVDRQGLLAAGAAVGVAVGFAAQDVLKNIFGGILIILDQPFQVGDRVSVGGTYGEVVSIGLRSTRIVTPDDNLVSVPNTQVVDGQVANANAGALDCQVVTTLYLPGWVDVSRAKEIAYDAAANSKFVYLKKPIVVLIKDDFKETFLTKVVIKAYVIDARYEAAFASDVTETAKMQYLHEGMLVEFMPGSVTSPDGYGEVASE